MQRRDVDVSERIAFTHHRRQLIHELSRHERIGTGEGQPVVDNGSGLSMEGRVTAAGLGRMLQVAWRSPVSHSASNGSRGRKPSRSSPS